ncbi:MAG: polysaccharide deacetylase family protein [Chthoniobacterales bacterium]
MLTRFAVIPLLLAFSFPTCKKHEKGTAAGANASGTAAPSRAPSAAPAAALGSATTNPANAKPAIDQNAQVVVFGYHRFVNQVRRPDTEITPQAFEQQMQELRNKGIAVIGLQDFLAWRRGEKAIPARCAVITFDDGWKSQYDVAWPIMKKFGYPLTMFIYTEGIRPGHFSGGESMTWDQLADMRDAGVDIQAHTETHQDLRKPYDKVAKKRLSPPEYEQWLHNEVAGSKEMIEQKLGVKVNCFAVPYGYYNGHVKDVAMKAGYEAMFTVYGQPVTNRTPLDSVGRYLMEANKPKTFTDAVSAIATTASGPAVAEVSTAGLATQPADGETIKTALPLIKANLSSMGPIDPGTVQMRISSLGVVPANFDAANATVTYQVMQKLRDKTCTVILSAKSGGKRIETHWTFAIDPSALNVSAPAVTPAPSPKK